MDNQEIIPPREPAEEYVRGDVHVNTLEGFWSQMKRSINGTKILSCQFQIIHHMLYIISLI